MTRWPDPVVEVLMVRYCTLSGVLSSSSSSSADLLCTYYKMEISALQLSDTLTLDSTQSVQNCWPSDLETRFQLWHITSCPSHHMIQCCWLVFHQVVTVMQMSRLFHIQSVIMRQKCCSCRKSVFSKKKNLCYPGIVMVWYDKFIRNWICANLSTYVK